MKPRSVRPRLPALLCVLALVCTAAPSAHAFLWGSPVRKWIREADKALEDGRKAETEQRVLDACDAYTRAHELYLKAQAEAPGTQAEHVASQDAECRSRLRTLFALASSGQVQTPSPDEVVAAAEAAAEGRAKAHGKPAESVAEATPAPEVPPAPPASARSTEESAPEEPAAEPMADTPEPSPAPRRRTWLGRLIHGKESTPPEATETPTEGAIADAPATTAPVSEEALAPAPPRRPPRTAAALDPSPSSPDRAAPGSDAALNRKVQKMLAEGAGADAVILLESIVEEAGEEATLTQRLLFAQALVNRRNYARAERILTPLTEQHPDDPAVLMLMSGLQLAQGNPFAALRHLDRLVLKYPRFADAYVNLAYTRFAMDPDQNRDEAILYYRNALTLGAERDPRLEMELRVDVQP